MPSLSVIILNHNGAPLLEDCLGSLRSQTYRDFEIIFVDNGSSDESVARAQALCPECKIITLPQNTGFAKGNNIGIQAAAGRYIVLLNNDTKADAHFLEELVRAAESGEKIGMVAPKILNFFEPRRIDSVGGLLLCADGIGRGRGRGEIDRGQYDGLRAGLLPSGCAALYKKEMLDETGLLPEEFFAYCEDADLGLRGRWAGWSTAAAPRAVVFHKYSATGGHYSAFKMRLVERNHYFLALRNFPLWLLMRLPFCTLYRWLLMAWAVLTAKGTGQAAGHTGALPLLGAFWRGHWQALVGAPFQLARRPKLKRISNKAFTKLLKEYNLPLKDLILNE
jgi:GT2 family glycosyltransferase